MRQTIVIESHDLTDECEIRGVLIQLAVSTTEHLQREQDTPQSVRYDGVRGNEYSLPQIGRAHV